MKITNEQEKLDYSKGYRVGYALAMSKARGENSTFIDFRNDNSIRGKGMKAGYRAANALLADRGVKQDLNDGKFHKSYKTYQNELKQSRHRISDAELDALLEGL